jgi:hypothetical protein
MGRLRASDGWQIVASPPTCRFARIAARQPLITGLNAMRNCYFIRLR